MVRGARLRVLATIVCVGAAIGSFPGVVGLEQIKKIIYNNNGFGAYSFEFQTSDGTYRQEDGGMSSDSSSMVVRGEYGYIDPSGRRHIVRYIADSNGFQPLTVPVDDTRFNDRRIV